MIDFEKIGKRRTIICNNCGKEYKYCGTWPLHHRLDDHNALIDDTVASSYCCQTDSCKVKFGIQKDNGDQHFGPRFVKVLEPDLRAHGSLNPDWPIEISPR